MTIQRARPANLFAFTRQLMGRLTRVQEKTFGLIAVSHHGLFINNQLVAHPYEIIETARALIEIINKNQNNFETLQKLFNQTCRAEILEREADIQPIKEGLTELLIEGSNLVGIPQGAIIQNAGKLYVNGTELITPDANLLAEAMARKNILEIKIDPRHRPDTLLKAISAIFDNNELAAKGILEALGINYRYFLPSCSEEMVYIASSDGLVNPAPILTLGEMKERGFNLEDMLLRDPVIIKGEEEIPLTFDEKVQVAIKGIRKLNGGKDVVIANLDLVVLGREGEVFGLALELNVGGVVEVNKQIPTRKLRPIQFVIDERACMGVGCGDCIDACPQGDEIEMVIPPGKEYEVAGKLEEARKTRKPEQGPLRIEGTFARIRNISCDSCGACFVACLNRGDAIRAILNPQVLQRLRLEQYPSPAKGEGKE